FTLHRNLRSTKKTYAQPYFNPYLYLRKLLIERERRFCERNWDQSFINGLYGTHPCQPEHPAHRLLDLRHQYTLLL
ncbi:MAG TPA: hypothetical protein V6D20_13525, partial [Candidatus Obscuribacterales bacterium]